VKKRIIEGGFDGAVILRLVDAHQETTYVPPNASSTWDDGGRWGYNSYQSYHVSPGYTVTDTFVRAENQPVRGPQRQAALVRRQ
jgi:hypothetical protein